MLLLPERERALGVRVAVGAAAGGLWCLHGCLTTPLEGSMHSCLRLRQTVGLQQLVGHMEGTGPLLVRQRVQLQQEKEWGVPLVLSLLLTAHSV